MNNINMLGRLTRDVDFKVTQSGVPMVTFSIACSKKYRDKERVCFITCKAFNGLADTINGSFRKGDRILISGELMQDTYTNSEGKDVTTYSIMVEKIDFIEQKKDGVEQKQNSTPPARQNANIPIDDNDLPF